MTYKDKLRLKLQIIIDRISWIATLFCASIVGIIVVSYIYYFFQSYRGPSPIYFLITLLLFLFSKTAAFFWMVFLLPIAPALHEQISFVHRPAVPFFIASPGIDICAAFVVGVMLNNLAQYKRPLLRQEILPWPIALTLIIIVISCVRAVFHNISQLGLDISVETLGTKLLLHKLILRGDVYLPILDIFTFSVCAILMGILSNYFKVNKLSEKTFLKGLTCALYISAIWGIFQALTRFGLPPSTYEHRANALFHGANGFQPDLHAFGALMLIGCIGLMGYINCASTSREKSYLFGAMALSWIALLLSKSRASVAFAVVAIIVFLVLKVAKKKTPIIFSYYFYIIFFLMVGITALPLLLTSQFFIDIYPSAYFDFDLWNNALSLRPEFHRAAIRMYSDFPWFGAGQSNFIRLSADPVLNYSSRAVSWKGDNAHNYFLQTLAELGVVGLMSFVVMFVWPFKFIKSVMSVAPACMIIVAIFLGNIYSHSLIVRENLFVLAIVVALIYAKMRLNTVPGD